MRTIVLPQGKGKTRNAIKIANEAGAYLLVKNKEEVMRIKKDCDRTPITFDAFLNSNMPGAVLQKVVIDDANAFISYLFKQYGIIVEGMTVDDNKVMPERLLDV